MNGAGVLPYLTHAQVGIHPYSSKEERPENCMAVFSWPRFKNARASVGLELQSSGLAAASLVGGAHALRLEHMGFLTGDQPLAAQPLRDWVQKNDLSNSDCHWVLGPDHYQLLLVEPPNVPEEELRNAVRFKLKDLINGPLDETVVDLFALPEDGLRGNKKMIYVVASNRQTIQNLVELTRKVGLNLCTIDIPELALRNVTSRLAAAQENQRSIAIARMRAGGGSVFLYRQDNLYLARNFSLDYAAGLLDDLPVDALALELQRSVDYFERQMGQAPPSVIYICGDHVSADKVSQALINSLAIPVQYLDPAVAVSMPEGGEDNLEQLCLGALGGALRGVM